MPQIHAEADNPLDSTSCSYTTRILLGRRDDPALEAYARTLVELITQQAPSAGSLLLGICIREHSPKVFREVMRIVCEHRVW